MQVISVLATRVLPEAVKRNLSVVIITVIDVTLQALLLVTPAHLLRGQQAENSTAEVHMQLSLRNEINGLF
jgi:hypothetical protein